MSRRGPGLMRAALLLTGLFAACTAGCGCNSAAVNAGNTATTPDQATAPQPGTPAGPGTAGPGPIAEPALENIPADQRPDDPTPPQLRRLFERLDRVVDEEGLQELSKQVDAERDANPSDALAWYVTTIIRAHTVAQPAAAGQTPKLDPVKTALANAVRLDSNGQWQWLQRHCDMLVAKLEVDAQGAADAAADCVKLAPGFVRGRVELARMFILNNQLDAAERLLDQTGKLWPDEWQVWFALAGVHLAKKDLLRSLEATETAVAKAPDVLQLRQARLQLKLRIWKDLRERRHEDPIRVEIKAVETLAREQIKNAQALTAFLKQLDQQRKAFEFAVVDRLISDLELQPATERTYERLLAHIDDEDARRMLVIRCALRLGEVEDPAIRTAFLLEVLAKDAATPVRIDAVRGIVYDATKRDQRHQNPWPEQLLARLRPLALPTLLTAAADPTLPRLLRTHVLEAVAELAEADPTALPPLTARLVLVAREFLKSRAGGDGNGGEDPLDIYGEMEALMRALRTLAGVALAELPHFRDDGDDVFEGWLKRIQEATAPK